MKEIRLRTVPHEIQRYNTVGDWIDYGDKIEIRASSLSDEKLEFLILVHELVECGLCRFRGISQNMVDNFDLNHELESKETELGDLFDAPYRREHCFATAVERMLAAELDVCWSAYEEELQGLS